MRSCWAGFVGFGALPKDVSAYLPRAQLTFVVIGKDYNIYIGLKDATCGQIGILELEASLVLQPLGLFIQ